MDINMALQPVKPFNYFSFARQPVHFQFMNDPKSQPSVCLNSCANIHVQTKGEQP